MMHRPGCTLITICLAQRGLPPHSSSLCLDNRLAGPLRRVAGPGMQVRATPKQVNSFAVTERQAAEQPQVLSSGEFPQTGTAAQPNQIAQLLMEREEMLRELLEPGRLPPKVRCNHLHVPHALLLLEECMWCSPRQRSLLPWSMTGRATCSGRASMLKRSGQQSEGLAVYACAGFCGVNSAQGDC